MAENKVNSFLKHKRLIFIGLIFIGLLIMILLTYVLTYTSNKPKGFKDDQLDSNVTVVKKNDYFKFECVADEISLNKENSYLKLVGEISNVTQTISDVSVTFEIHNKWTKKGSYTSDSEHKINSGNQINPTTTTTYQTTSTKISLNTKYPITVLPLVKVNNPIVFAKVSYSRKLPDSMAGKGGYVKEVVYYRFSFNDYVSSGRTVIN